MTPRQQRGADTVERLLTAALDVYADRGPEGFTVTAVTSAGGISLGSLYHHFGTFDGLAVALYGRCLDRLLDRLVDAVEGTDTEATGTEATDVEATGTEATDVEATGTEATAAEAAGEAAAGIRAAVVAYLRFVREEPAAARVIHLSGFAPRSPEQAERFAGGKAARMGRLLAWLRPHTRSGAIVDLPDLLIEMLLIGPPAELARRWLAGAADVDLTVAADLLPERVWQSVRGTRR